MLIVSHEAMVRQQPPEEHKEKKKKKRTLSSTINKIIQLRLMTGKRRSKNGQQNYK